MEPAVRARNSKPGFKVLANDIPTELVSAEENKGKITYSNKRAIQLFGFNPQGLTLGGNFTSEECPLIKALLYGQTSHNIEVTFQRPNQTKLTISMHASPLTNKKGETTRVLAVFEDITNHKQLPNKLEYSRNLEQQVEELTKQLKNSERLATIGQVAGMVGHDIRNPLQTIVNELYYSKVELSSGSKREIKRKMLESLALIEKQVEYINRIVSDLQDYAKSLQPNLTDVDLKSSIEEIINEIDVPSEIQTTVTCQRHLPLLKLDKIFLKRIVSNLVINAIQAMPQGGKLNIKTHQNTSNVALTVEDTGTGIPLETKNKIFTPLFTTKTKGQGFGLAVVKRMTEAMNGTVTFESELGVGTKFTVMFPKKKTKTGRLLVKR